MAMEPKPCVYSDIRVKGNESVVAEPAVAGGSAVADGQLRGSGDVVMALAAGQPIGWGARRRIADGS